MVTACRVFIFGTRGKVAAIVTAYVGRLTADSCHGMELLPIKMIVPIDDYRPAKRGPPARLKCSAIGEGNRTTSNDQRLSSVKLLDQENERNRPHLCHFAFRFVAGAELGLHGGLF